MWNIDDFVLEREDQALDCFATVDELGGVIAHEEIASVQQDSFEEAHDIVNCQICEERGDCVGVYVWQLVEAGLLKLEHFILSLVFIWQVYFDCGRVFSHWQRDREDKVVDVIFELGEHVASLDCTPQVDVDLVELLTGWYLMSDDAEALLYEVPSLRELGSLMSRLHLHTVLHEVLLSALDPRILHL